MRDGKSAIPGTLRTFSLIGLMAVTGGCDTNAALPPLPVASVQAELPWLDAPEARSRTDHARNRDWILTREGLFMRDRAVPEAVGKLEVPGWHWAGEPYGYLPDLALGPKGEAVITSDVLATLWRIDPETLAVSEHALVLDADTDKDIGFSGLAYSSAQGAYFAVSHGDGSLWRIDPTLKRGQTIQRSTPVPGAYGLTVPRSDFPERSRFLTRLCVSAPQGSWSIDLAPDQRSAYVRTATCKAS